MAEFIFMLTRDDTTVPDAVAIYEEVRATEVRWVGFKDVGRPVAELAELARRIRADGRRVVMEVVSISEREEVASIRAALRIGVDVLMGGTRIHAAIPLLRGQNIRYFPFPGRIVGHPSILEGSIEEIVEGAVLLSSADGVDGLDLLAYRFAGDVPGLVRAVVAAVDVPVVVAGSIDSADRIHLVSSSGAWGFTVGSAIFDGSFQPGASIADQVRTVLSVAREGNSLSPARARKA